MHNTNRFDEPTQDAYRELLTAFDFYNARLFGGRLAPVLFTYQRQNMTMGYYSHHRFIHRTGAALVSELAINPSYFLTHPVRECLQTLVHEMCHAEQWQYGKPSRNGYHNAEWVRSMLRVGLMPSDTGQPGGRQTGQKVGDYPIAGGLFELATNELLASGFQIAWIDRYPPKDEAVAVAAAAQAATVLDVEVAPAGANREAPWDEGRPLGTATLMETLPLAVRAELVFQKAGENRSNRIKYTCGCKQNIWGKPALQIRCEGCKSLFAPQA
ncbi:SprT-like domain-containing protein [Cupriavidus basilensis]